MIPESFAALYAFLGLVAPGLIFQLMRERDRPTPDDSAFREASSVALASLAFSSVAVGLLWLVSLINGDAFVDLAEWLTPKSHYVSKHVGLVAWSLLAEVVLACLVACGAARIIAQRGSQSKTPNAKTTVWYQALKDKPKDKASFVLVELKNETRIWGYVHYFTADETEPRDISLKGPGLTIQKKGEEKAEQEYWVYVVVTGSDIQMLKVAHEDKAPA